MNADSKTWINPRTIIKLLSKTLLSRTSNPSEVLSVTKSRELKITVEAWRASMYCLAVEKLDSSSRCFIQQNLKDPPDFYGLNLFMENGKLVGYENDIEVFEYPNESKLEIFDELKKKILKAYSSKTILICHITNTNFKESLGSIYEKVLTLHPRNEIWIIGSAQDEVNQIVARVYPNLIKVEIDVSKILETESKPAFITGIMGKSNSLTFENTGKQMLITPQFEITPIASK